MPPLFTVVVPAYNVEKYVVSTLRSLAEQTFADFEVIVVNDGSTDGTLEAVNGFCAEDSRFRCVTQDNSGVSSARNSGIALASGKYIVFLDSDDLLTAGSLRSFYDALEESGADMAVGRLKNFGAAGDKFNPYAQELAQKSEIEPYDESLLWNFLVGNKCFRLSELKKRGTQFPPLKYTEDGVFIYDYILPSSRITGAPDACLCYRRHDAKKDASVTQTVRRDYVTDYINAMDRIYSAAEHALADSTDETRTAYLSQVAYKANYTLLAQFYRLFWQADDSVLAMIYDAYVHFRELMGEEEREKLRAMTADLGEPMKNRASMATSPKISVVIGKMDESETRASINSVFYQSSPVFEVIVRETVVRNGWIDRAWSKCENIVVLPDKGFSGAARRTARSKKLIFLRSKCTADERVFKFLLNINMPELLKNRFFGLLFKAAIVSIKFLGRGG